MTRSVYFIETGSLVSCIRSFDAAIDPSTTDEPTPCPHEVSARVHHAKDRDLVNLSKLLPWRRASNTEVSSEGRAILAIADLVCLISL